MAVWRYEMNEKIADVVGATSRLRSITGDRTVFELSPEARQEMAWAWRLAANYKITAGIKYQRSQDTKLDIYQPPGSESKPTLVFLHAGAWSDTSTKETWSLWFLPFLQLGWVVVNIDYRPSAVALAPAAVLDCGQAWRWVHANADQYCIDRRQVVLAGLSAGGHLALLTGMLAHAGSNIPPLLNGDVFGDLPQPAAIINWCGITDVVDLTAGKHRREFALKWLGSRPDALAMASAVSPLTYIRPGLPPTITIHGDEDDVVPYGHATRLHESMLAAGVTHELVTLPGARHASLASYMSAYPRILDFLAHTGITVSVGTEQRLI
jgi:acetyl esterase/lipase